MFEPSTHAAILAFGVLPDEEHVDVVRGLRAQRRLEAGQDFDRAQVHIKVEPEADSEQQVTERNVVWHADPAVRPSTAGPDPNCAEPDRPE